MDKQIMIAIGREYGSGGHEIARHIAEAFEIPLYDRYLLDAIATEKNVDNSEWGEFDETTKKGLTRTVRGFTTNFAETIAEMQFDYLRDKASKGQSFVVVGRCAETVLRDYEGLIPIFVMGDYETKLERVMDKRKFSAKEAALAIKRHDKSRKAYHNRYCDFKWGDSRNYDICINSSKLGIEGTVKALIRYIEDRLA